MRAWNRRAPSVSMLALGYYALLGEAVLFGDQANLPALASSSLTTCCQSWLHALYATLALVGLFIPSDFIFLYPSAFHCVGPTVQGSHECLARGYVSPSLVLSQCPSRVVR